VPAGLAERRYVIALPDDYLGAHEVWALSATTRSELDGVAGVPVHAVPLPVPDVAPLDPVTREAARDELDWPDKPDAVVFVTVVDHAHERADNALGAGTAFVRAFPERQDVRLLMLVEGADEHQAACRTAAHWPPPTTSGSSWWKQASAAESVEWLNTADCLLAPHRVERGWRGPYRSRHRGRRRARHPGDRRRQRRHERTAAPGRCATRPDRPGRP